jgi:hypothetical protein
VTLTQHRQSIYVLTVIELMASFRGQAEDSFQSRSRARAQFQGECRKVLFKFGPVQTPDSREVYWLSASVIAELD